MHELLLCQNGELAGCYLRPFLWLDQAGSQACWRPHLHCSRHRGHANVALVTGYIRHNSTSTADAYIGLEAALASNGLHAWRQTGQLCPAFLHLLHVRAMFVTT